MVNNFPAHCPFCSSPLTQGQQTCNNCGATLNMSPADEYDPEKTVRAAPRTPANENRTMLAAPGQLASIEQQFPSFPPSQQAPNPSAPLNSSGLPQPYATPPAPSEQFQFDSSSQTPPPQQYPQQPGFPPSQPPFPQQPPMGQPGFHPSQPPFSQQQPPMGQPGFPPQNYGQSNQLPQLPQNYQQPEKRKRNTLLITIGALIVIGILVIGGILFSPLLFPNKQVTATTTPGVSTPGASTPTATTQESVGNQNLIFSDAFADNTNGWKFLTNGDAEGSIANNALNLKGTGTQGSNTGVQTQVPLKSPLKDLQISLDYTFLSGELTDSFIVQMRTGQDQVSGYVLSINPGQLSTYVISTISISGGQPSVQPLKVGVAMNTKAMGQKNSLTVTIKGSTIVLEINGEVEATVDDATYKNSGDIGLICSPLSGKVFSMQINKIEVRPAPATLPA